MGLVKLASIGINSLARFAPTLNEVNGWAVMAKLPQPLYQGRLPRTVDRDRYSALVPGQLWLHRDYRMIGWGYKWPASLQFKMEYTPEEADQYTHKETFRVPFI